jgi:hypothetical protein
MHYIRDNAINSLMTLNQSNKSYKEYIMIFNDFERPSKADMNDDILCNRFITCMANIIVMTRVISHRKNSVSP